MQYEIVIMYKQLQDEEIITLNNLTIDYFVQKGKKQALTKYWVNDIISFLYYDVNHPQCR